jgi:signal transduction histidine kinase
MSGEIAADLGCSKLHTRADATPHAASLIQSLRDLGYSCRTAIADIIDNAITAEARRVDILCDAQSEEPIMAVLDDGIGMTRQQLIEAMRPGSHNPLAVRVLSCTEK